MPTWNAGGREFRRAEHDGCQCFQGCLELVREFYRRASSELRRQEKMRARDFGPFGTAVRGRREKGRMTAEDCQKRERE